MNTPTVHGGKPSPGRTLRGLVGVCMAAFLSSVTAQQPLYLGDFTKVVTGGFGDRQNSMAWSMQWFRDALYVGTFRSAGCVERAITVVYYPWMTYPPDEPEMECADPPEDLPLRAEIWRWTPGTDLWQLAYRSPEDIEIPGHPGKFVARDVGFRDMAVFTDPDGTEALYVAGFTARDLYPSTPPPRILRTTDGVHFDPVPQDPGTFLGDLDFMEGILISGFSRFMVHDGRLFAIAGGAYGHGVLLESGDPQSGNDSFGVASAPGVTITAITPHRGSVYLAEGSNPLPGEPGYDLQVMETSGNPPYPTSSIVPEGAYRLPNPSTTVAHLKEYGGALWAGTNRPTELIRVNPDDSWDLLVGDPRMSPEGMKYPFSGLGDGFDWYFNIHIHRMETHDGFIYLATNDQSNQAPWTTLPWIVSTLGNQWGFDVYRASDGFYFYPVTDNGFEAQSYNFTGRNLVSTAEGLFIGTGNSHYGLQVWRGQRDAPPLLAPPQRLELERKGRNAILSWEPSPGATSYRILRSDFATEYAFLPIGSTTATHYVDDSTGYLKHMYVVEAESGPGQLSSPSNLVRSPSLLPTTTFSGLEDTFEQWGLPASWIDALAQARTDAVEGRLADARASLGSLRANVGDSGLPDWRRADLEVFIGKLERRVGLAELGILGLPALL